MVFKNKQTALAETKSNLIVRTILESGKAIGLGTYFTASWIDCPGQLLLAINQFKDNCRGLCSEYKLPLAYIEDFLQHKCDIKGPVNYGNDKWRKRVTFTFSKYKVMLVAQFLLAWYNISKDVCFCVYACKQFNCLRSQGETIWLANFGYQI